MHDAAAPGSRINRNPVFCDLLPREPAPSPDVRDTLVPAPRLDPRDSTTRPVTSPSGSDDRSVLVPGTGGQAPFAVPVAPAGGGSRP